MKPYKIITSLLMATALTSCTTKKQHSEGIMEQPHNAVEGTYTKENKETSIPFWGDLFIHACRESSAENVCVSPLSAQFALSMTANGATGETRQQMYGTMGLDAGANVVAKGLMERFNTSGESCTVNIANSIWINDRLNVKKEFVDTNRYYFDAETERIPFIKESLARINGWCSEKTNGKIKSILGEIKKSDRMYLINALYFKGGWKDEFRISGTKDEPFTKADGNVTDVPMMKQVIKTSYYEDETIQMADKPFKGGYRMLLVLPREGVSMEKATTHLAEGYTEFIGNMSTHEVTLSMPRFRNESAILLNEPLKKMGMPKAFGNAAEFNGISDTPLHIDNVLQKTFINVDEKGAEAAAVTAIMVGLTSMPRQFEKRTMTLDRPFIYIITDNQADNILFIGKVGNPSNKN